MNKVFKISNIISYFLVTYIFISVINENNSSAGSFYFFEKPQEDGIEKVIDITSQIEINFRAYFSKSLPKSIQKFDIAEYVSREIFEELIYNQKINEGYSVQIVPIQQINFYQKIITKKSTALPPEII